MSEKPFLSVIIPVYNVEVWIRDCLDSLACQTRSDFEAILVDDGSEDSSGVICDEYAGRCGFIRVIHTENRGILSARRTGVLTSKGDYIVFMDPDDFWTDEHTAQYMHGLIEKYGADCINYRCKAVGYHAESVTRSLMRGGFTLEGGRSILLACFAEKRFTTFVWNKLFRGDMTRLAAGSYMEDNWRPSSEDVYMFFILGYLSRTFVAAETPPLLTYRFGTGVRTQRRISLECFSSRADDYAIWQKLCRFAESEGIREEYAEVLNAVRSWNVNWACSSLFKLPVSERPRGMKILLEKIPADIAVEGLSAVCSGNRRKDLQDIVCHAEVFLPQCPRKDIRTIAIFYPRYTQGGVERVISLQMPLFQKMGLAVVFMTNRKDEQEFSMPEGMRRVILPEKYSLGRARVLKETLEKYDVDAVILHALSSQAFMFDALLIRSCGVPVIGCRHESTTQPMLGLNLGCMRRHKEYRLLNRLVVLSRTEENYYKLMGCRASYFPNIVQFKDVIPQYALDSEIILWNGRLDDNTKQFMDALEIIDRVVRMRPSARLVMLGMEWSKGAAVRLRDFVAKRGLEKNVDWLGYCVDVEEWYAKARLMLLTSATESFSMAVIESKSFGLPLVTYSMPWLELFRHGGGYVEVAQGDVDEAAEQIVRLLESPELCLKYSREALASLEPFKTFDHKKAWQEIFDGLGVAADADCPDDYVPKAAETRIFLEMLGSHYEKGVLRHKESAEEYKLLKKDAEQRKRLRCVVRNRGEGSSAEPVSMVPAVLALDTEKFSDGFVFVADRGEVRAKIKCIGSGMLEIMASGIYVLNEQKERRPIWIDILECRCNGEKMFDGVKTVCFDRKLSFKKAVNDGDVIMLEFKWAENKTSGIVTELKELQKRQRKLKEKNDALQAQLKEKENESREYCLREQALTEKVERLEQELSEHRPSCIWRFCRNIRIFR